MKIATWNVNSIRVRLPQIAQWLTDNPIDILALQETKVTDDQFPKQELAELGYQAVFSGQKTYNGVAILSRENAGEVITDIPGLEDPQRRILAATVGDIRVIDLYIPNGETLESEKYSYKLHWLEKVTAFIEQQLQQYEQVVVLGDFNIAPEDRDVHDPKAWEGKVLVSEPERAAFRALLALPLVDTFRAFEQPEKTYSWWNYRELSLQFNRGLRIDHVLASTKLMSRCVASYIDKTPRKWQRPSDHTPVIVEFKD